MICGVVICVCIFDIMKAVVHALKLNLTYDVELLLSNLEICLSKGWPQHFNKADFSGNWSIVSLRSATGEESDVHSMSFTGSYSDCPILEECTYFKTIIDAWKCEKQTIRLMNLQPGSHIKKHSDPDLCYASGCFRIHIPIQTNDKVEIIIDNEQVPMKIGECWYGNFDLPHAVSNNGDCDRIHLVMDCIRNDWTDQLFINSNGVLDQLLHVVQREPTTAELKMMLKALREMEGEGARNLVKDIEQKLQSS